VVLKNLENAFLVMPRLAEQSVRYMVNPSDYKDNTGKNAILGAISGKLAFGCAYYLQAKLGGEAVDMMTASNFLSGATYYGLLVAPVLCKMARAYSSMSHIPMSQGK
jgi:hypothetical protein